MYGYVYKVTNVDTGAFYIGKQEYNEGEDFTDYFGSDIHPNFDISKWDRKCFVKEKIDEASTEEELSELTRKYIRAAINTLGNVNDIEESGFGVKCSFIESLEKNKYYSGCCAKCKVKQYDDNLDLTCKDCISRISYEENANMTAEDFEEKESNYHIEKIGNKIALLKGKNVIIEDVSFILNTKKEGNTFIMPEGLTVTDRYGTTNVKKIIKNENISNWLEISFYGLKNSIIVTEDHPLVTDFSDFVKARDLKPDQYLLTANGKKLQIKEVKAIDMVDDSFDLETESGFFNFSAIRSRNCRTRVASNVYDPSRQIIPGRGNLSFTTINLPRLAILANKDLDKFFASLDEKIDLVIKQLLHRLKIQSKRHVYNYKFLMGQGVWIDSDKLKPGDEVGEVIKHGTLTCGFIGLAETLISLIGKHHGESEEAQELGLKIVQHMRDKMDEAAKKYKLNFSLIATPAEGLCLAPGTKVQTLNGLVNIENIREGDLVVTFNENSGKKELKKVVKAWMSSPSRKVVKVVFNTGENIICTPNHPFGVSESSEEQVSWVTAEDLKAGMRIKSNLMMEDSSGHYINSIDVSEENMYTVVSVEVLSEESPVYDLSIEDNHNFFVGGINGLLVHNSGRFVKIDKKRFGELEGITDKEYYTNSFHVPVYYKISAYEKIKKEAPYHALCNGGHISYIEMDGDPTKNLDAFVHIVQAMKKAGMGYSAINHPVDRDPVCGFNGIINDVCPGCGRRELPGEPKFERIRRITGYLVGDISSFNDGKKAEEHDRVKHA